MKTESLQIKKRLLYFLLACLTFLSGISILIFFKNNNFIRGFIGDVLVVILMYFAFRSIFLNFSKLKSGILVFLFALGIEILQYFKLADYIKAEGILRTALGTHFDPLDIIAYFIGFVLVYTADYFWFYKSK